jgi:hypothetical protein
MKTLTQFSQEFNKRHDFQYEDCMFLPRKFPYILFVNIPEDWVCEIDRIISLLDNNSNIIAISQIMGFLVVSYNNLSTHDIKLLKKLEYQLSLSDIDLYDELKESTDLN